METVDIIEKNNMITKFGNFTLFSLRPIVGAKNEINKMRRKQFLRFLKKIDNWDNKKKIKFLDILTDIISAPYFSIDEYIKWVYNIENKINELKEFKELKTLKDLERIINHDHLKKIRQESMEKLKRELIVFLENIYLEINKCNNNEKIKNLIVLGSMIQHIIDLIDQNYEKNSDIILLLLLRTSAYLMDKISLDELQIDLMRSSNLVNKVYLNEEDFDKYTIKF